MLILSRRPGESLLIGANVTVTLLSIRGHQARIGIDAPRQIPVQRPDAIVRLRAGDESEPAANALHQFGTDYFTALYLFHLADLGVADALHSDPLSAAELAEKVHADPHELRRALCFVANRGIFAEDADGRFRHNALSRLLRADQPHSQRAWFRLGATHLAGMTSAAIGQSLRTGRPPVELAAPHGISGYLVAHPDEALALDEAVIATERTAIPAILGAYDFSAFRSIADIGGGRGELLRAIIAAQPAARGILFDLPAVIGAAQSLKSGRLTLQAGDFFEDPLPVCDAYLLMNVIREWPDARAVEILKAIRRVAPTRAKLLILEAEPHAGTERATARAPDLFMPGWPGGGERAQAQHRKLLETAGFTLGTTLRVASDLSLFEASVRQ